MTVRFINRQYYKHLDKTINQIETVFSVLNYVFSQKWSLENFISK